jgi:hypothetical protein
LGHNPSFTNWHFDPGDFGLAALLYFGEFSGGELQIGPPFCKTVQLENLDLKVTLNFLCWAWLEKPWTKSKKKPAKWLSPYNLHPSYQYIHQ